MQKGEYSFGGQYVGIFSGGGIDGTLSFVVQEIFFIWVLQVQFQDLFDNGLVPLR